MIRRQKQQGSGPVDWKKRFAELGDAAADPGVKAFYQSSCPDPGTPVSRAAFLALDLETTGMDPEAGAIVSVGFIPLSHNRIFCSQARHWIIRPDEAPPDAKTDIHGITHTRMNASPRFPEILPDLLIAMASRVILVHYHAIERGFLGRAVEDLTGDPFLFPVIDTMVLEAQKHPVYRPNFIQRWMGDTDSPSLRLSHSRERYGLPQYTPHHALTDALASAELFLAQLRDRYPPDTPVGDLWL